MVDPVPLLLLPLSDRGGERVHNKRLFPKTLVPAFLPLSEGERRLGEGETRSETIGSGAERLELLNNGIPE